uniref:Uncharacterized protein n=1 Tax=Nelumbo nucifera TaxID=4432 RepID=A0A822XGY7_NELNU|nr:TPA_asm: hypothetical protein HUJ06_020675 [Nelumbo nucifera]
MFTATMPLPFTPKFVLLFFFFVKPSLSSQQGNQFPPPSSPLISGEVDITTPLISHQKPAANSVNPDVNDTVISSEKSSDPDVAKIVLSFSLEASVALMILYHQPQPSFSWFLWVISLALCVSFSASIAASFLFHPNFPKVVKVMEQMSVAAAATVFFLATGVLILHPFTHV